MERLTRRQLVIPAIATLVALAVLLGLGTWQLQRKAWKEQLIATLTARLDAPPIPLPPAANWDKLDAAEMEFRHVAFPATFLPTQGAHVYTTGSSLRGDVSGPGFWVFAPARVPDGMVMVNRGFVPYGQENTLGGGSFPRSGLVNITGVMRWPEVRGMFTPTDKPATNLWFVRDHLAIAAAKGIGPVAPVYIEQETPQPPDGLPRPGKVIASLPNSHLQYALTWYGLALVLVVVFVVWARSSGSGRASAAIRPDPAHDNT
jgi:surfeit locus 1 family protein